jgi:hypothetical protein
MSGFSLVGRKISETKRKQCDAHGDTPDDISNHATHRDTAASRLSANIAMIV